MSEVVRALRDRGVTRLRLDVVAANVHAITFYRRLYAIPLVMHPTPRSSVDEMTMALHDVTLSPPRRRTPSAGCRWPQASANDTPYGTGQVVLEHGSDRDN